ncbi:hypothetical protein [Promineifilum sp.]|uniref:hypothetical protein n=1 Tax=Promineifilum sp. TaxID=2664178 RepID=UPI0035B4442A
MNRLLQLKKAALYASLLLAALVAIVYQQSLSAAMASDPEQKIGRGQTDVISVALREANTKGLIGKYEELGLLKASISEIALPGDEFTNHSNVWVAWIRGTIVPNWPGAINRPNPARHLYVFIDADTGQVFQLLASDSPILEFGQRSWVAVSESDVGKYSIPDFAPATDSENVLPASTETPAE